MKKKQAKTEEDRDYFAELGIEETGRMMNELLKKYYLFKTEHDRLLTDRREHKAKVYFGRNWKRKLKDLDSVPFLLE